MLVLIIALCLNSTSPAGCSRTEDVNSTHVITMSQDQNSKPVNHRQINLTESDIERFWKKLKPEPEENGCHLWTGGLFKSGYALFSICSQPYRASRVAYTLYHGPIPDGMLVLHGCDDRICVSKKCLHLGTCDDNAKEMVARNRQSQGDHRPLRREPWRAARGERHMSVTRPETVVRGDDHWTRRRPELLLRGESHPNFGSCENVPHGETHHFAKLNPEKVREIRRKYAAKEATQMALAEEFHVRQTVISDVVRLKIWKHVI